MNRFIPFYGIFVCFEQIKNGTLLPESKMFTITSFYHGIISSLLLLNCSMRKLSFVLIATVGLFLTSCQPDMTGRKAIVPASLENVRTPNEFEIVTSLSE